MHRRKKVSSEETARKAVSKPGRDHIDWHLDLELPSLQNGEKSISVV